MTSRRSSGSMRGECCRTDQVREHDRDLAAFGTVFGRGACGTRLGCRVNGGRLTARVAEQGSDCIQELHTVTKRGDTKLLQVLVRQARENRLVYVILTEDRLVLREAQAPQPTSNIHDGRPNPMGQRNLGLGETACPGPYIWVNRVISDPF